MNTEVVGILRQHNDLRKDNWHGLTGIETRDRAALTTGNCTEKELAITGNSHVPLQLGIKCACR